MFLAGCMASSTTVAHHRRLRPRGRHWFHHGGFANRPQRSRDGGSSGVRLVSAPGSTPATAHVQLAEDLSQVPTDGARAGEQLRDRLRIRQSLTSEARGLLLLGRQVTRCFITALAHVLAGRDQLATRTAGEPLSSNRGERLVRLA
jgi:hypothetical protein